MKILTVLVTLFIASKLAAQSDTVTDTRDNQKYQTIVIGKHIWFREHLRYETKQSYFPNFDKTESSLARGNYYSNAELDRVCPKGWHVATLDDWEDYITILLANHQIPKDSVRTKILPAPNNSIVMSIKNLNILHDTLLHLAPIGWVEGNKIANDSTLTLWIVDNHSEDDRYHVHIGALGYVKHSHKHHVIDKLSRIRKFAIRCVCEVRDK